jgi:hypothetical protein
MKKTIAKLMAAAMLLSAVPAVTMPTFVSQAKDDTVSATSATQAKAIFEVKTAGATNPGQTAGTTAVSNKGVVAIIALNKDTKITKVEPQGTVSNAIDITATQLTGVTNLGANQVAYQIKASLKNNLTSSALSELLAQIKGGTNTFYVHMSLQNDNATSDTDTDSFFVTCKGELYSKSLYRFGGEVKTGNKVETGIYDSEALLNSGDVYGKIGSLSTTNKDKRMPEIELLQGVKGQIKDNDALRGNTLDLSTVWIQGMEFKVNKLGSQALKEAHMKKLLIKNVTQVGKGALRKCKNVRKVNLNDKNKVRKIRSKAFYDCKNLKHINIDGRKLKEIGKDAFKKVKKKCVIKVKASKSKYNEVVKKIKKSGAKIGTDVKVARVAP